MTTVTIHQTPQLGKKNFQSLDDLFWYCVTNNLLTRVARPEEIDLDPILSASKDAEESSETFDSVEGLLSDLT